MGTPNKENELDSLYDWGGLVVQGLIRGRFNPRTDRILDVGAGWGKYRRLLPEFQMDACEVWAPYVEENQLRKLYDTVFVENICDLIVDDYAAIIMGDIFEHLDKDDAATLLSRLCDKCREIYIVVPYHYPQGITDDNPFEIHQQADLSTATMLDRYPLLDVVLEDLTGDGHGKGLFCWRKV